MKRQLFSRRIVPVVAFAVLANAGGSLWSAHEVDATTIPIDAWAVVAVPGTYTPSISLTTPSTTTLAAATASATCVDGAAAVSTCSVGLSIALSNVVCGAGVATSAASATVTVGGDVDTYNFDLVVLAGVGVLEGSLVDEGVNVGPAGGVMAVVPGPIPVETCLLLQHVTVTATVWGVTTPRT